MEILPSMSPRHAVYVQDYVLRCGGDPNAIFHAAGWNLPEDAEQHKPIPVATMARIFAEAAKQMNDPDFGLHTAQYFPYESSGMLTLAILSASNLDQAFKMLARYGKHIDSGFLVDSSTDDTNFTIKVDLLDPLNTPDDQLREYLVALFLQLIRTGTKKDIKPERVTFSMSHSRDRESLQAFFDCPIEYGTTDTLVFDHSVLTVKFVTAHHLLFEMLTKAMQSFFRSNLEDKDLISLVSREIIKHTSVESLSLEKVAEELSMSPRTLRRKLAEEGHSFQEAKKMIRQNRAHYFLSSTAMSLAEISYELGYSEISAFSRAFRSWTGESPQAFRQREKAAQQRVEL